VFARFHSVPAEKKRNVPILVWLWREKKKGAENAKTPQKKRGNASSSEQGRKKTRPTTESFGPQKSARRKEVVLSFLRKGGKNQTDRERKEKDPEKGKGVQRRLIFAWFFLPAEKHPPSTVRHREKKESAPRPYSILFSKREGRGIGSGARPLLYKRKGRGGGVRQKR